VVPTGHRAAGPSYVLCPGARRPVPPGCGRCCRQTERKGSSVVNATGGGLSRVTIVAPQTRIDLALPSDVPLIDLLPTVLRYAGEHLADDRAGREGWVLSRLGGPALDSDRSPEQLEVRDGELIYLRPRGADLPEPVFDDVVDAVATATQDRVGRWQPATSRLFGLAAGVVTLLAGAVMVLFAGPPQLASAVVGLGTAVVGLAAAIVLARAVGDSRTGVVFAVVALVYSGVGGLLILAGDSELTELGAPHVLVAGIAVMVVSAIATVGVADGVAVFVGSSVAALALCLGAVVCLAWRATPASAAAVVVTLVFAAVPLLPMISYRLAGLPIPSVPTAAEDLKTDVETVQGARVLALSDRSDEFLAGFLSALGLTAVCASLALTITGGLAGVVLASVLGLLMLVRARWFIGIRQRLPLLIGGALGLGVVTVDRFLAASQTVRLSVGLGTVLVVAVLTIAYAVVGSARRRSPIWGRLLDIVEMVLVLAVVPLALWATGLYGWIRTISER